MRSLAWAAVAAGAFVLAGNGAGRADDVIRLVDGSGAVTSNLLHDGSNVTTQKVWLLRRLFGHGWGYGYGYARAYPYYGGYVGYPYVGYAGYGGYGLGYGGYGLGYGGYYPGMGYAGYGYGGYPGVGYAGGYGLGYGGYGYGGYGAGYGGYGAGYGGYPGYGYGGYGGGYGGYGGGYGGYGGYYGGYPGYGYAGYGYRWCADQQPQQAPVTNLGTPYRAPAQAPTAPGKEKEGTYQYDGGPVNPMPTPSGDYRPTLPRDGKFVSMPRQTTGQVTTLGATVRPQPTRYTYPAYGESR